MGAFPLFVALAAILGHAAGLCPAHRPVGTPEELVGALNELTATPLDECRQYEVEILVAIDLSSLGISGSTFTFSPTQTARFFTTATDISGIVQWTADGITISSSQPIEFSGLDILNIHIEAPYITSQLTQFTSSSLLSFVTPCTVAVGTAYLQLVNDEAIYSGFHTTVPRPFYTNTPISPRNIPTVSLNVSDPLLQDSFTVEGPRSSCEFVGVQYARELQDTLDQRRNPPNPSLPELDFTACGAVKSGAQLKDSSLMRTTLTVRHKAACPEEDLSFGSLGCYVRALVTVSNTRVSVDTGVKPAIEIDFNGYCGSKSAYCSVSAVAEVTGIATTARLPDPPPAIRINVGGACGTSSYWCTVEGRLTVLNSDDRDIYSYLLQPVFQLSAEGACGEAYSYHCIPTMTMSLKSINIGRFDISYGGLGGEKIFSVAAAGLCAGDGTSEKCFPTVTFTLAALNLNPAEHVFKSLALVDYRGVCSLAPNMDASSYRCNVRVVISISSIMATQFAIKNFGGTAHPYGALTTVFGEGACASSGRGAAYSERCSIQSQFTVSDVVGRAIYDSNDTPRPAQSQSGNKGFSLLQRGACALGQTEAVSYWCDVGLTTNIINYFMVETGRTLPEDYIVDCLYHDTTGLGASATTKALSYLSVLQLTISLFNIQVYRLNTRETLPFDVSKGTAVEVLRTAECALATLGSATSMFCSHEPSSITIDRIVSQVSNDYSALVVDSNHLCGKGMTVVSACCGTTSGRSNYIITNSVFNDVTPIAAVRVTAQSACGRAGQEATVFSCIPHIPAVNITSMLLGRNSALCVVQLEAQRACGETEGRLLVSNCWGGTDRVSRLRMDVTGITAHEKELTRPLVAVNFSSFCGVGGLEYRGYSCAVRLSVTQQDFSIVSVRALASLISFDSSNACGHSGLLTRVVDCAPVLSNTINNISLSKVQSSTDMFLFDTSLACGASYGGGLSSVNCNIAVTPSYSNILIENSIVSSVASIFNFKFNAWCGYALYGLDSVNCMEKSKSSFDWIDSIVNGLAGNSRDDKSGTALLTIDGSEMCGVSVLGNINVTGCSPKLIIVVKGHTLRGIDLSKMMIFDVSALCGMSIKGSAFVNSCTPQIRFDVTDVSFSRVSTRGSCGFSADREGLCGVASSGNNAYVGGECKALVSTNFTRVKVEESSCLGGFARIMGVNLCGSAQTVSNDACKLGDSLSILSSSFSDVGGFRALVYAAVENDRQGTRSQSQSNFTVTDTVFNNLAMSLFDVDYTSPSCSVSPLIVLSSLTVINVSVPAGTPAIVIQASCGNFRIVNSLFRNVSLGVLLANGINVEVIDSSVSRSRSSNGVIELIGGELTVLRSNFTSNKADVFGGAVTAERCVFNNSTFTLNIASQGGAAFCTSATVSGSNFTSNQAVSAGALLITRDVSITGSTFTSNTALGMGSVLSAGRCDVQGSRFVSNTNTFGAGGLNCNNAVIAGSYFEANSAATGGSVWGQTVSSVDSVYSKSTATEGGAIYAVQSANSTRDRFTSCTALQRGAGVYSSGTTSVSGGVFGEGAATIGGGLYSGGPAALSGAVFRANRAALSGGGLALAAAAEVTAAVFDANTAALGGAMSCISARESVTVRGSSFTGKADSFDVQVSSAGTLIIRDSNFSNMRTERVVAGSTVAIHNSTFTNINITTFGTTQISLIHAEVALTIEGSVLQNNTQCLISYSNATLMIRNTTFDRCDGNAVQCARCIVSIAFSNFLRSRHAEFREAKVRIDNTTFVACSADFGGALAFLSSTANVTSVSFVQNAAQSTSSKLHSVDVLIEPNISMPLGYGGAISAALSTLNLKGVTISQNKASVGGAVAAFRSTLEMRTSAAFPFVAAGNVATYGGLFYVGPSVQWISVADQSAEDKFAVQATSGPCTISNNTATVAGCTSFLTAQPPTAMAAFLDSCQRLANCTKLDSFLPPSGFSGSITTTPADWIRIVNVSFTSETYRVISGAPLYFRGTVVDARGNLMDFTPPLQMTLTSQATGTGKWIPDITGNTASITDGKISASFGTVVSTTDGSVVKLTASISSNGASLFAIPFTFIIEGCPPGSGRRKDGSLGCEQCIEGYYSIGGQSRCHLCSNNQVCTTAGLERPLISFGYWRSAPDASGVFSVVRCAQHELCEGGDNVCGRRRSNTSSMCRLCGEGSHVIGKYCSKCDLPPSATFGFVLIALGVITFFTAVAIRTSRKGGDTSVKLFMEFILLVSLVRPFEDLSNPTSSEQGFQQLIQTISGIGSGIPFCFTVINPSLMFHIPFLICVGSIVMLFLYAIIYSYFWPKLVLCFRKRSQDADTVIVEEKGQGEATATKLHLGRLLKNALLSIIMVQVLNCTVALLKYNICASGGPEGTTKNIQVVKFQPAVPCDGHSYSIHLSLLGVWAGLLWLCLIIATGYIVWAVRTSKGKFPDWESRLHHLAEGWPILFANIRKAPEPRIDFSKSVFLPTFQMLGKWLSKYCRIYWIHLLLARRTSLFLLKFFSDRYRDVDGAITGNATVLLGLGLWTALGAFVLPFSQISDNVIDTLSLITLMFIVTMKIYVTDRGSERFQFGMCILMVVIHCVHILVLSTQRALYVSHEEKDAMLNEDDEIVFEDTTKFEFSKPTYQIGGGKQVFTTPIASPSA